MTKSTFHPTEEALLAAVEQFVQQSRADGCNPAELSRALTAVAVRIGGDLAPAFAFAMRAVSGAAGRLAESRKYVQRGKSAMRSKRKSDRDRRSINVAAERQHSSTSRDVSELQAAFCRCHSDSEFRALFIASCRNP